MGYITECFRLLHVAWKGGERGHSGVLTSHLVTPKNIATKMRRSVRMIDLPSCKLSRGSQFADDNVKFPDDSLTFP